MTQMSVNVGVFKILPILLKHDHFLDVYLDENDKFIQVVETMPPLVNYRRLRMPQLGEEYTQRMKEWSELEQRAYR